MIIPKEIERSASGHFLLDLHTDYLQRIYDVVHEIDPAKILLKAEDISKWNVGIKDQSEITREVRASKTTEDLGKKDEERDRIITSLFQDIRSATLSPIAARSEPGRTLKLIVDVYKGLQRERRAGKTVHTKGLLDDLAKPEAAAAVAALHLTETVALLRTTNDAFSTLRESRTSKSVDIILPKSEEIRAQNDKMTSYIFQYIEAAYIATTSDEDRKAIGQLIDQINARIRESKATQRRRRRESRTHPKSRRNPSLKSRKRTMSRTFTSPKRMSRRSPEPAAKAKSPTAAVAQAAAKAKSLKKAVAQARAAVAKPAKAAAPRSHCPRHKVSR